MAFPTSRSASEAFDQAQAIARRSKMLVQDLRDKSASGNTAIFEFVHIMGRIQDAISTWDLLRTTPGIAQYARDQYANQALDIAAEFTAMRTAAVSLRDAIFASVPKDENGFPLLQTLAADGTLADRTVTPAQSAGFRTQADAFTATIG